MIIKRETLPSEKRSYPVEVALRALEERQKAREEEVGEEPQTSKEKNEH